MSSSDYTNIDNILTRLREISDDIKNADEVDINEIQLLSNAVNNKFTEMADINNEINMRINRTDNERINGLIDEMQEIISGSPEYDVNIGSLPSKKSLDTLQIMRDDLKTKQTSTYALFASLGIVGILTTIFMVKQYS
jgi:hypothetical protein